MNYFDPFAADDDFTPEEEAENERIEAANRELWRRRMEAGWTQDRDGRLRHPDDFDIWMMIDPFSRGLILSDKLSRKIQADLQGSQVA